MLPSGADLQFPVETSAAPSGPPLRSGAACTVGNGSEFGSFLSTGTRPLRWRGGFSELMPGLKVINQGDEMNRFRIGNGE